MTHPWPHSEVPESERKRDKQTDREKSSAPIGVKEKKQAVSQRVSYPGQAELSEKGELHGGDDLALYLAV